MRDFTAWFTTYPKTHVKCGQSVEVVTREVYDSLRAENDDIRACHARLVQTAWDAVPRSTVSTDEAEIEMPITTALRASDNPMMAPNWLTWRVGRKVGRISTIYAQVGSGPSDADVPIGTMDTPDLAREAVNAHNAVIQKVQCKR